MPLSFDAMNEPTREMLTTIKNKLADLALYKDSEEKLTQAQASFLLGYMYGLEPKGSDNGK